MRKKSGFITTPIAEVRQKEDLVTFVLLAENYGYRMKSRGALSLVEVKGKTLLEIQMQAIGAFFPNFEIILCCGYDSKNVYKFIKNKIRKPEIRIVENQVYENSNCCETARIALNNTLNDKIVIMSGGLLITPEHLKSINTSNTCILSQSELKSDEFQVGVIEDKGVVQNMCLGIKQRSWLDFLYLNGEKDIEDFYNVISSIDFKNRFLFEAINQMIKTNTVENVDVDTNKTIKINSIKSLKRIEL
jgi:choline kinase